MKIGIVGYFNPYTVVDYLSKDSKSKVMSINETATSVNVLVKSFLDANHQVVVFTGNHYAYDNDVLTGERITVYVIGLKIRYKYLHFFVLKLYSRRIKQCISRNLSEIEILHAHWTYDYADASSNFVDRVPVVCTVRDWAPYIYTSVSGLKAKILWIQKRMMSKRVLDNSSIHFVSNSYYTQQRILSMHPEYDVPILFNSIEDKYILRDREKSSKQYIFISISPTIDENRKNCDTLIKAFSLFIRDYPDAKLLMIGIVNPDSLLYKKWEKQELLNNVEFLGYVDHSSLIEILDEVTCLVHPSLEETFGNILLEGMARRIPVIGGESSGAVPFVLKHGECGCLCDITNPESIRNAMIKIVENKIYTESIVNNATSVLFDSYASSVVGKKHIQLYDSIIKS